MKHYAKCECDLCFADGCEAMAEAWRQIREGKSPLATLPGWHHAEQLAREVGDLNRKLLEAAE